MGGVQKTLGFGTADWTPYQVAGADHSCLGLPISDEQADGAGRISRFEHGTITWKPGDILGHANCS
jgi:uncharacterized protein with LGFP repeats